jgi:NhaP-type Na+/H+ or K+/H+ antiporter
METAIFITVVGMLVFLAHLFSGLFQATRIPDVLPLVLIGVVIGPVAGLISPGDFGRIGQIFTTVALVIILFEGGLGLKFATLRASLGRGMLLTVLNLLGTMVVTTVLSFTLLRLTLLDGLLLGAILGGTSSAVVIPMINKLRITTRARTTLLLESAISDVLCIVLALALIKAAALQRYELALMARQIGLSFLVAAVIGGMASLAWSYLLQRARKLDNSIFLTPAFVFVVFGVTELSGFSGAIAALVFGLILGNVQDMRWRVAFIQRLAEVKREHLNETEKLFLCEIVFLLKTFFFVYLGLSIRLTHEWLILLGLVMTFGLYVIRLFVVRLAVSRITPRYDATIASIMIPKGLAAAALASLPLQAGMASGAAIQDAVYAVVLFSIIGTAALAFAAERNLLRWPYNTLFAGYGESSGEAPVIESESPNPPIDSL